MPPPPAGSPPDDPSRRFLGGAVGPGHAHTATADRLLSSSVGADGAPLPLMANVAAAFAAGNTSEYAGGEGVAGNRLAASPAVPSSQTAANVSAAQGLVQANAPVHAGSPVLPQSSQPSGANVSSAHCVLHAQPGTDPAPSPTFPLPQAGASNAPATQGLLEANAPVTVDPPAVPQSSPVLAPSPGPGTDEVAASRLLLSGHALSAALVDPGTGPAPAPALAAAAPAPDAPPRKFGTGIDGSSGMRYRGSSGSDADAAAQRLLRGPGGEPTCFQFMVNGEIESAQEMGSAGRGPLMCVFSVQYGPDWTIVSGAPQGITQLACSSLPPQHSAGSALLLGGGGREVVWNFPVGLVFKSTSPFGWPRIVVTIYGTDICNRRVIKGYGSVHFPCQPGRHVRTIRLYCPISSSPLTRILGVLFGNPAQLVDPRTVAGTEGRDVIRVQSGGRVRLSFEVLLKDTEPFNYSF